jgi:hypothetical protein
LNFGQVVLENNQLMGRVDPMRFPTTSHAGNGKSSNRSQNISSTSDNRQKNQTPVEASKPNIRDYQTNSNMVRPGHMVSQPD